MSMFNDQVLLNNMANRLKSHEDIIAKIRSVIAKYNFPDHHLVDNCFQNALETVSFIKNCQLNLLSRRKVDSLNQYIDEFERLYKEHYRLIERKLEDRGPVNNPEDIALFRETYTLLIDFLEEANMAAAFFSTRSLNSAHSMGQTLNELEASKRSIIEIENDAKTLLKAAQSASGKQVAENYAKMFEDEATTYRKSSNIWLLAAIAIAGAVIAIAWNQITTLESYSSGKENYKAELLPYLGVAKFLIVSTLFFALSVAVKNYRWSKHNETVSKHRYKTLASFQSFIQGFNPDETTKNLILMEVTKTMYGNHSTGFVDSDSDDSPIRMIEILKPGMK